MPLPPCQWSNSITLPDRSGDALMISRRCPGSMVRIRSCAAPSSRLNCRATCPLRSTPCSVATAAAVSSAPCPTSAPIPADDTAIAALREAASVEDQIPYDEPPGWHAPARHTLGALLLAADRASEAEAVYREELQRNPHNGWSLYGLTQSLRAQQREDEAAEAQKAFEAAWQFADVELSSSRL